MTREEKIIATAFTGKMFIDNSDMGLLYEYMEKKVGHGVIDIMMADKAFWEELHRACEQDFVDMVSKEQPSLPSNLDEAVNKFAQKEYPDEPASGRWGTGDYEPPVDNEYPREIAKDAFKAGAEWQKERDKEVIEVAEDHALFAGREQMREEMMKDAAGHLDPPGENGVDGMSYLKGWNDRWKFMENDAVVGYIRESEGTHWIESKPDEKIHGKVGDEVKLLIVKEE